ncbi:DUF1254 domain-containing protein [Phenylobacterium aquaticum]|uniref:DUF1254 domain-containing protein n=1 Tax=Phenylobacterium aquaticum TaxID=1763816 RepID=UPI0026F0A12B|nr:DUF1254 domain-containing protein [Phenylobacterium aquaticum]
MNRRELMAVLAAIAATPAGRALAAQGDLKGAAREAWLYALPLIEMAQARVRMLGDKGTGQGAATNRFVHARKLVTPAGRTITTPNNDTLYSSAWLDLTQGPATLTLPPTGKRYLSVAVLDMYTDNDVVLGTRTVGPDGGTFTLVGPGQKGGGANVVRVSTPHAWLLARTLVDGEADMAAAHAVQDGIVLKGAPSPVPKTYAPRSAPWDAYFTSASDLLAQNPPRPEDLALFGHIAPLGLGPKGGFDPKRFDADAQAQIKAGIGEAVGQIMANAGRQTFINGWGYPRANLGVYGQDYLYRAMVALGGLAALPVAEAMYMRAQGEDGNGRFKGDGLYRLSLPAQLPLDGFWSLTMYEATPQGQFFLTENALHRYAIGDRTPGLARNPDGGVDIWIGRTDPGGDRRANWLPAPVQGPFAMTLRAYLPRAEFLDGRYRLPPVVAV